MKKFNLIVSVFLLILTALSTVFFAQSGRAIITPTVTPQLPGTPESAATEKLEKVTFVVANGFDDFLKQLNSRGKSGYKLEKAINYGGEGAAQKFAAVLVLNAANSYQYELFSSPNKNFLESRLNYKAGNGFILAGSFALTACGKDDAESDTNPATINTDVFKLAKGDVFLLEKKNGIVNQTKEYKVFVANLGLGKSPTQVLQTALDDSPAGFRPVRVLFSKTGLADFAVSILLEKDLTGENQTKIEYKFVKEVNGFEKQINALAAQGFRVASGRRIGLIKFALMAKESNAAAPVAYTLIDEEKYAKEFDKTILQGNVYQGILAGDASCDSAKIVNEKLFFAKSSDAKTYDYKILKLVNANSANSSSQSETEFRSLSNENYRVKDLFYSDGLNIIFEK